MIHKTGEARHHTDDEVRGYLETAAGIVAGLELDDDLRVPAFVQAIGLLAAKQIAYEQMQPSPLGIVRPLQG